MTLPGTRSAIAGSLTAGLFRSTMTDWTDIRSNGSNNEETSMISAIVLAGGLSKRMGQPKPLLPFGKRTLIEHIVHQLFKTGLREIFVITGHEGDSVSHVVKGLPVHVVHNFTYESGGMLSSVKIGIRAVSLGGTGDKNDAGRGSSECKAALICLGDQPAIEKVVVERLVEAFNAGSGDKILVPSFEKKGGHPIMVPAAFFSTIVNLPPEGSLRDVIGNSGRPVEYVDVDTDSVLHDINTPEEYERELDRLGIERD